MSLSAILQYSAGLMLSCKSPTVNKTSILQKTALMKELFRKFYNSNTRAEEFGQNYVRSVATSVDKSENSPQFSYIILS